MMFSRPLFARSMKECSKTLIIFTAVLALYMVMIVMMYDPTLGAALNELTMAMPEIMALFNMMPQQATLEGFMSAYLYGFLMQVFPMVFVMLAAGRLIAKHTDTGSMAYLLAAPVTRKAVAFTQMKALASGVFALIAVSAAIGAAACEIYFPGELHYGSYALLNLGTLCLQLFIGGICFICSCFFGDYKTAMGLGCGIPTAAFVIQMLSGVGEKFEAAKYLTFFTLFDPNGLIEAQSGAIICSAILFAGALALFAAAILVFDRRDMHI